MWESLFIQVLPDIVQGERRRGDATKSKEIKSPVRSLHRCEEFREECASCVDFFAAMAFRGAFWVALFLVGAVAVCAGRALPSSWDVGSSIAMVTDLNAGRFTGILGHSKEVLHFAGFAAKYVLVKNFHPPTCCCVFYCKEFRESTRSCCEGLCEFCFVWETFVF